MKKSVLLSILVFLVSILISVQPVTAQEKSKEEQELELKLKQALDLQKKAMADQKRAAEQQAKELDKVAVELDRNTGRGGDGMNFYRARARSGNSGFEGMDEAYVVTPGVPFPPFYGHSGDSERTTWDFSKQVKETTFSRDYTFDVESTANSVIMTVMGDCKAGQIRVKILMPGGKVYSDIVIDEFGNLNWRKSFSISEEENKDKAGEWKFKIDAEKATGFFKISLQTY